MAVILFFKFIVARLRKLGPGLVTGASRNDPSSITTYALIGARAGYSLLWTLLISLPLLAGIQDISARVGRVTGNGIAANLRIHYQKWLLYLIVFLLAVANLITLGADIRMLGESATLLFGGSAIGFSAVMVIISVALQISISYQTYAYLLKWLTLALLAYIATALTVEVDWMAVERGTFIPTISLTPWYLTAVVAAFGATINPYMFFWQASQEVEEQARIPGEEPLRTAPEQAYSQIQRIKLDTYTGMTYSNVIAFFIMLTTAVTLHSKGIYDITSATEAAVTLRPIAGDFSFILFSIGMIGAGLLAVPVLAGSLAYAVGEALDWPVSLDCNPIQGKGFYSVLVIAVLLGYLLNFLGVNPIRGLYWAALANGITAIPIMIVLLLVATNRRVMGQEIISLPLRLLGWLTIGVALMASVGLLVSIIR